MYFEHASEIWQEFPELVAGVIQTGGITSDAEVDTCVAALTEVARERLGEESESQLAEIQAWRRAFTRMGLKPTQYRCAAESLLRRFRKEGELPRIHPLIDLCNAASLAFAIPVAVFDVSAIEDHIEVRHATGDERYLSFAGEVAPALRVAVERVLPGGISTRRIRRSTVRARRRPGIDYDTVPAALAADAIEPGDPRYGSVKSTSLPGGAPGLAAPGAHRGSPP